MAFRRVILIMTLVLCSRSLAMAALPLRLEAEHCDGMQGVVDGGPIIGSCDAGDWIC